MRDAEEFERLGRCWLRERLSATTLDQLDVLYPLNTRAGTRVAALDALNAADLRDALRPVFPGAFAVRAVAFDKSAASNWGVPWHQDRVIAVRDREDLPGFRNWSRKSGGWHCEPPDNVLRNMVFARIFLDDVDASNGGMELALRSHRNGPVPTGDAEKAAAGCEKETETAKRGDILVMSMFLLHRSGPAEGASKRRVVRADYANSPLPRPLRWVGSD